MKHTLLAASLFAMLALPVQATDAVIGQTTEYLGYKYRQKIEHDQRRGDNALGYKVGRCNHRGGYKNQNDNKSAGFEKGASLDNSEYHQRFKKNGKLKTDHDQQNKPEDV